MTNYCGNCTYQDKNQKEYWGNRYYCEKTCKYKEDNEKACNLYIERKPSNGYTPAGCFITTIICTKLGYQDNCDILETLRYFRESYLKMTAEGIILLQEYDVIGPIISAEIAQAPNIDSIILAHRFIIPCYDYIKQGQYDNAISVYKNMVIELKERYSYAIQDAKPDYTYKTPIEELGKGRIRLRPANI